MSWVSQEKGRAATASPSQRLEQLGLSLPEVATPLASYVPAVTAGGLVHTAGQLPSVNGSVAITGKVGTDVTPEQAAELARTAVLNALAAAAGVAGGLDEIHRVVRVVVFVASAPDFTGQSAVANGASNLLGEIFGDDGIHVRSAVGVAVLPLDAPVEVELVVEPYVRAQVSPASVSGPTDPPLKA